MRSDDSAEVELSYKVTVLRKLTELLGVPSKCLPIKRDKIFLLNRQRNEAPLSVRC